MKIHPRAHIQKVGEETAIVQFETGQFYGMNEIGAAIFDLIKDGKNPDEIIGALVTSFEIDESQAKIDTTTFINDLIKENILQP
jgi:hypothetical protein